MFIPRKIMEDKLKQFFAEDVGQGDVTASAVIPPNLIVKAEIIAKEKGVAAGVEEAIILAEYLGLKARAKVADGGKIKNTQVILEISGDAQTILSVERTMLNLLSRMSGIATKTRTLTEKLQKANSKARIASTRKSAPGLLYFDKKAVIIGGGDPHRLHLDDMILIKDNHLAIVGGVEEAIKKVKTEASFTKKFEVEVTSLGDALKAAEAGADIVMLDNFSAKQAKAAGEVLKKSGFGNVLLEVSGGISSENLLEYAEAQVDIISLGELTHSVKALDMSLEIVKD
jgi:nicotinate-nucleotide pyrophosphorylase (carboxylating)